jgi:hypothetical protein
MSTVIADWKSGVRQRLLWIDFERYAWRVFAGGAEDWYRNAARFAATLGQALRVVRSDVVAIDVAAPLLSAWATESSSRHPDAASFIDFLSTCEGPRAFVADVADALGHSIGSRADLVLKFPCPRDLMMAAGIAEDAAQDFGALDDLSTALVALLRQLSSKHFAGVQLLSSSSEGLSDDETDAYAPIFSTAGYYGWATCLTYMKDYFGPIQCGAQIGLFPNESMDRLLTRGDPKCGGGLTSAYWLGSESVSIEGCRLPYGLIPEEANPETVIEKIKRLV